MSSDLKAPKEETMDEKKILLALDGSDQSREAARFISGTLPPDRMNIVLLMIFTKMPEAYWDVIKDNDGALEEGMLPVVGRVYEREKAAEAFMEQMREFFVKAGVRPDAIKINIQDKKLGVARDILAEAEKDEYRAVVVGRSGRSKMKDFVMGSTAHKIVQLIGDVPVWVVDGAPAPGKILVAVDNSSAALRIVDCVGELFAGTDFAITLFHAARELGGGHLETEDGLDPSGEKAWLKFVERKIGAVFVEAVERLAKAGVNRSSITIKIQPKVASRASAIIEAARSGRYGAIFAGRRGLSQENTLLMGRVTYKLIQLAREKALCIVP